MNKRFVAILVVIIVGFLGLVVLGKSKNDTQNEVTSQPSNHVLGSGDVKLIEYGDFQCPACGGYHPIVQALIEKYGDKISFQFKHFPIVAIHPNAMAAHRAAEAAGLQDKFFEMHDLIYETQDNWSSGSNASSIFEDFANRLGLDMEKYRRDVASSQVQGVINADVKEGQSLPVTGTPTFVLNGKKIEESPRDVEGFSKLIDEALANNTQ